MNLILGFIKLLRPLNIAVAAFAVLVSAYILGVYEQYYILTCVVIVVITYNGAANAFNDYCDYEIDLINRPNRPLSRGMITGFQALSFAIILFGIGSVTAMNGRHFGAAAYHAAMALKHDMIVISMTTGGMNVVPVDGAKPMVGLNPIGIAVN